MRMTALREYEPAPGRLVEWHPTESTSDSLGEAREHPAPPSSFQENHLRRALANDAAGAVHSPWLATAFDLPGELDPVAMAGAWQRWVRRHATLLTWFENTGDELRRCALDAADVAFAPVEVGEYGSGADIRDHLLHRFATATSALSWPPFVLGAVLRPESSTVFFAVDHAHTDGYSIFLVFDELRRLYWEQITGEPAGLPEVGDHADFAALERGREIGAEEQAAAVRTWSEFWLEGGSRPPSFPLPLGLGDEPRGKLLTERELFDAEQATAFGKRCREHRGSFPAGVFAALAIAAAELAGTESYRTLTPVQTRDEPRWAAAQGWFVNLVPLHFSLAGLRTFGEVLAAADEAFVRARAIAGVPVVKLVEMLGSRLRLQEDARTVLPIVSFIDLRRVRGSELWEAAGAQVLSGPGEGFDVPMWINRLRGLTYLKASYPDTPVAAENVARYLDRVQAVLHRVLAEGDHEFRGAASLAAVE
ncbi:condensation domain-containing protein [Saccharopolyspora sp. 6M]|uniref:condensation domain-containing protein n=1 Tax=Saccharopolyspora sp. 6M TaxID=2877237 RepID=UPI001CD6CCCB|nr:condensation domain-containing protein [Saccharopolyspora sp. 6M]MCA1229819.1 condensation domain-containing protein [Saccharopolyspora sp. 6M]